MRWSKTIKPPIESGCVVTLGEVMLRLKAPGHERLLQSALLEATFGGSEANVAIALSVMGQPARFVSALPANVLGQAAVSFLASFGVDVSHVARMGERLGIYFTETGADLRPSTVLYDRAQSAMAMARPSDFDWPTIFKQARWFHVSGITPAISPNGADVTAAAVRAAKQAGLTVSLDLNYRRLLWNYGRKPTEVVPALLPCVDVLVANEEDIQHMLGIGLQRRPVGSRLSVGSYRRLIGRVLEAYPSLQCVAVSLRESHSANYNGWSAVASISPHRRLLVATKYALRNIVDRLGAGDAFAAGLIFGLCQELSPVAALEFAVAASALKHTIPGDANRLTIEEIGRLANGDRSGRIRR